jgi:hypothetical protein
VEVASAKAASRVRREKAALSSGCKPHPATAPAGSNRSSHVLKAFLHRLPSAAELTRADQGLSADFPIIRSIRIRSKAENPMNTDCLRDFRGRLVMPRGQLFLVSVRRQAHRLKHRVGCQRNLAQAGSPAAFSTAITRSNRTGSR